MLPSTWVQVIVVAVVAPGFTYRLERRRVTGPDLGEADEPDPWGQTEAADTEGAASDTGGDVSRRGRASRREVRNR